MAEFSNNEQTPFGAVSLDADGIVWLVGEGPIGRAGAVALYEARLRVGCPDEKQRLMVDLRKNPQPDKTARDFTDSHEVVRITAAMALLTDSPVSRMLGNFFLGFNRASFPTRMFTDEQAARDWLPPQAGPDAPGEGAP